MSVRQHTWAVVLAAGDGTRLATVTTDRTGNAVPKQFCSLDDGRTLLGAAFHRAHRVVSPARTCVIVSESHQRYWRDFLQRLPPTSLIVQPGNRGTATGVLLSVLSILELDPLARILFLPADHYVRDEPALRLGLRDAVAALERSPDRMILVGIEPDRPDTELGYIVPGALLLDGSRAVIRFVEKPDAAVARDLFAAGALWNSFIFAGCATALLGLVRRRLGTIADEVQGAFAQGAHGRARSRALAKAYERLPSADFSRNVMQGAETYLRVVQAPSCGWNDLGTPKRLADISAQYRVRLSVPGLYL